MMKVLRISTVFIITTLLCGVAAQAQVTSSGTVNVTLINRGGIAILFHGDPSGVNLVGDGSSAATLNFGLVSRYGSLSAGVTRPATTATSFTVRSFFDIFVSKGALPDSNDYTLTANLAAPAPTGFAYRIGAFPLTTTSQTIATTGAYNADVAQTLDLVISTLAPGAGGPVTGTPVSTTINFTATAN
jgi:hypothetical protein